MDVDMKRSMNKRAGGLVQLYLMGSPFIGISMTTLMSLARRARSPRGLGS